MTTPGKNRVRRVLVGHPNEFDLSEDFSDPMNHAIMNGDRAVGGYRLIPEILRPVLVGGVADREQVPVLVLLVA